MSGDKSVLAPKDEDISKLLMAGTHLGSRNVNFQMESYVYKRRQDGTNIINLHKTWEKLLLAARVIVAIENPKDVCAISGAQYGQRAVLKFAVHVGANAIAGRFTPGTFTNQIQRAFQEPRLLVVTDPRVDSQPVQEAAYVNLPVIAFCDTDSPLRYVDIAIPGNNKSIHSIGLLWWLLAREVLRFRATILRTVPWDVMPDLYFYRDLEEAEKEEMAAKEYEVPAIQPNTWDAEEEVAAPQPAGGEWGASGIAPSGLPVAAPVFTGPEGDWSAAPMGVAGQDWSTTPAGVGGVPVGGVGANGWDAAAPQ